MFNGGVSKRTQGLGVGTAEGLVWRPRSSAVDSRCRVFVSELTAQRLKETLMSHVKESSQTKQRRCKAGSVNKESSLGRKNTANGTF